MKAHIQFSSLCHAVLFSFFHHLPLRTLLIQTHNSPYTGGTRVFWRASCNRSHESKRSSEVVDVVVCDDDADDADNLACSARVN